MPMGDITRDFVYECVYIHVYKCMCVRTVYIIYTYACVGVCACMGVGACVCVYVRLVGRGLLLTVINRATINQVIKYLS